MGWFDAKHEGKKVLLGDGAMDLTDEFLRGLAEEYKEGADRKPTLEELAALLELVLGTSASEHLHNFETRRVTGVRLTAEKKPKDQAYAAGDVFAIPFGKVFVFGRIMSTENPFGSLIEIFRETSKHPIVTPSILASGRLIHPLMVATGLVIPSWDWLIVQSDPKYKMSKEDAKLEFGATDGDEYWTETYTEDRIRDITAKEWKQMTKTGAYHPGGVEKDVAKALKLPPPGKKKAATKAKPKKKAK